MTIVYSVICRARDAGILVELATEALDGSNAPQVTTALLEHLRDNPAACQEGDLKTFVHRNEEGGFDGEDFFSQFMQACTVSIRTTQELDLGAIQENYFHLWYENGVFFCCLSDNPDPKEQKVNFAFLQAVSRDFGHKYSPRRIKNCNAYAMDKEFRPIMRTTMDYYNVNRTTLSRDHKINALVAQVEDMKTVLGRNITLLLEREGKIDRLMQKSEQTRRDSMVFKRKSIRMKKEARQKSYKLWFLIAGMFLVIFVTVLYAGMKRSEN